MLKVAASLGEKKARAILATGAEVLATGNIGCITQLASGMDIPIAHTVELLDWAYGGPMPRGLEKLARHVQDVFHRQVETPAAPPEFQKQYAFVAALQTILTEYRKFIAYAPNL